MAVGPRAPAAEDRARVRERFHESLSGLTVVLVRLAAYIARKLHDAPLFWLTVSSVAAWLFWSWVWGVMGR